MKTFNEICKEIIDLSQEFDPKTREIFDYQFVKFIKTLQIVQNTNKQEFDPNQENNGVDVNLIKKIKQKVNNINNIDKQKMKQKSEEIKEILKKG